MVDMLLFIHGYARNVIFYNHKVDPEQGPYAEVGDWLDFFENSLPFHLARFSDFNAAAMEAELDALAIQVKEGKSVPDLQLLFDHVYNEFFVPVERVWRLVDATAFKFLFELNEAIQTHIAPALERYLTLRNTAAKYLCVERISFDIFMRPPWDIPMERLFQSDEKVTRAPGGEQGAIAWFRDELALLAGELLRSLGSLAELAPSYVEESLNALEKRNEPHLGLLFAFIKLYTHFQKDLNNLSVAHLDFFYQKVLKIEGRKVKPDMVHLIFEIANHLNDGYLVEKGTTFRDGQDGNDFDVDFKLDDEIVIDKAQVVSLKTLHLNSARVEEETGKFQDIIEGIYIASNAKSADGKGEPFAEEQSTNWATLGSKLSKFPPLGPEVTEYQNHPYGRVGFVLSSPILWLNEGDRKIKITICGNKNDLSNYKNFIDSFYSTYSFGKDIKDKFYSLFSDDAFNYLSNTTEIITSAYDPASENGIDETWSNCKPNNSTTRKIIQDYLNAPFFKVNSLNKKEQLTLKLWLFKDDAGANYVFTKSPHESVEDIFLNNVGEFIGDEAVEDFINDSILPGYANRYTEGVDETLVEEVIEIIKELFTKEEPPPSEDEEVENTKPKDCSDFALSKYLIDNDAKERAVAFFSASARKYLDTFLETDANGDIVYCKSSLLQKCLTSPFSNRNYYSPIEKTLLNELICVTGDKLKLKGNPLINELIGDELYKKAQIKDEKACLDEDILNEINRIISHYLASGGDETVILNVILQTLDNDAFLVFMSGSESWFSPSTAPSVLIHPECKCQNEEKKKSTFSIEIIVELNASEPSVSFYNQEVLQENFLLKEPYPLIKLELDPTLTLPRKSSKETTGQNDPPCCLLNRDPISRLQMSLYHLFRSLKVDDICIEVEVCGVKNLLVQNEENIQDVNELVLPFGVRPKVDAEFYIGCKEILCKTWNSLFISLEWKDRPDDFGEFYADYLDENGNKIIAEDTFKVESSILRDGEWHLWNDGELKELFTTKEIALGGGLDCESPLGKEAAFNGFGYNRAEFIEDISLLNQTKRFDDTDLQSLNVNSREAFFRLRLEGEDFQHDVYPFVLARNLIQLAGLIDPLEMDDLVTKNKQAVESACNLLTIDLVAIECKLKVVLNIDCELPEPLPILPDCELLDPLPPHLPGVITALEGVFDDLELLSKLAPDIAPEKGKLQEILIELDKLAIRNDVTGELAGEMVQLRNDVNGLITEGLITNLDSEITHLQTAINSIDLIPGILENAIKEIDNGDSDNIDFDNDGILQLTQFLIRIFNIVVKDAQDNNRNTVPLSILKQEPGGQNDAIDLLNIIVDKIGSESSPNTLLKYLDDINESIKKLVTNSDSTNDLDEIKNRLGTIKGTLSTAKDSISIPDGTIIKEFEKIINKIIDIRSQVEQRRQEISAIKTSIKNSVGGIIEKLACIKSWLANILNDNLSNFSKKLADLNKILLEINKIIPSEDDIKNLGVPNEPYTPRLKSISIDYTASSEKNDIAFIHLYPFENTSVPVSLTFEEVTEETDKAGEEAEEEKDKRPYLFPNHTDEGTLFIGLDNIRPGATLQLLFQLAEATADSESDRAKIKWHYLSNNDWRPLRTGFEIISDDTNELTRSGIVKLSLPRDITKEDNTLMPPVGEEGDEKPVYWLKVSSRCNTTGVAETINIHTQAALATYEVVDGADLKRVEPGLAPEQLSKPLEPDFNIKQVLQPYSAFGGKAPEKESLLYKRVSEHLRHKGRSIDAFDIEHLVLEAFPSIFKCKCISHTLGLSANQFRRDLEVAPGFVVVAVIPDLTRLKAGDGLEPKAPVSMLEEIKAYLKERMSPFARLRVMNPRYEKIKVDTTVRIKPGRDEDFYLKQLEQDLTHFLAPWHLGDSDKLSFGQSVAYSEVIGFMEKLDYIDFIVDLKLFGPQSSGEDDDPLEVIVPATARSILTGGKICAKKYPVDCDPPDSEESSRQPSVDVRKKTHLFRSIEEKLEDG